MTQDITVIGMIKEMSPSGFVVEDPTGEVEVVPPQQDIKVVEDDVIAISGSVRNSRLFAKEIIYPDVPLIHDMGSIEATLLLTEHIPNESGADIICTPDSIYVNNKKKQLPNPAWVKMSENGRAMNMLVYRPENSLGLSDAVELLKKRHLSPKRSQISGPDDPFAIEPIPDIFWLVSDEKGIRAYKGVTIISCGQNSAAMLDLVTRKANFISP